MEEICAEKALFFPGRLRARRSIPGKVRFYRGFLRCGTPAPPEAPVEAAFMKKIYTPFRISAKG